MRKQYLTYIASLAAAATLTACGSSPLADEPGGLSGIEQMELPVIMSVAPTAGDGENIFDHGTQPTDPLLRAESAINPKNLFIATYTASDAKLIEVIYSAGTPGTGVTFYDHATWGPTFSFTLNKETHTEYNQDFYIVAYSLPKKMGIGGNTLYQFPASGTILNETSAPGLILANDLLGTENDPKTWTLSDYKNLTSDGSDILLPMAGCERITKDWLESTYNRDIYGVAPLQLPAIRMTRAVAKIVIEDVDEVIASATLHHNKTGRLIPRGVQNPEDGVSAIWWSQTFTDTPNYEPNVPTGTIEQTWHQQTPQNLIEITKEDDSKVKAYVFYAFEHDFNGEKGDSELRHLITLEPKPTTGLSAHKPLYIAPYDNGKLSEKSYDEIKDADSGAWRGLLRNHCYTFSVSKPDNGELQIYVKTAIWTVEERELFDF